jgi:hypothetical protein
VALRSLALRSLPNLCKAAVAAAVAAAAAAVLVGAATGECNTESNLRERNHQLV